MVNLISPSPQQEARLSFTLLQQIGTGGGGRDVWTVQDAQFDAVLALKRIPIAGKTAPEIKAFFDECKMLYLSRHPHVVDVKYGCADADYVYMAMPLYRNGCMKSLLIQRHLTTKETVRYSLQFLSGLNNIHSKGLLHFDIKPANILISDSDTALVSDFGTAAFQQAYGFANVPETTDAFAPPEYFVQSAHNVSFDIYQAGLVLYQMCSGYKDFYAQLNNAFAPNGVHDRAHLIKQISRSVFPDRRTFLPHIPQELKRVVKKALHIDPAKRYTTVFDLLNAVSGIKAFSDWRYSIDTNGNEAWVDSYRSVNATISNNTWTIFATKSNRRKTIYCKAGLSNEAKYTLLTNCLNTIW